MSATTSLGTYKRISRYLSAYRKRVHVVLSMAVVSIHLTGAMGAEEGQCRVSLLPSQVIYF
jgi:hypothetical protein